MLFLAPLFQTRVVVFLEGSATTENAVWVERSWDETAEIHVTKLNLRKHFKLTIPCATMH